MEDRPILEQRLDDLLRPALVVEPPPDVQQAILAAVLLAAAEQTRPAPVAVPVEARAGEGVPLVAYLLLAAVLAAYLAAVSSLDALFGGSSWITTLVTQLLTVAQLLLGRPATLDPLALAWTVLQRAPWLALLPVVWLLWERDQAVTRAA